MIFSKKPEPTLKEKITESVANKVTDATKVCVDGKLEKFLKDHEDGIVKFCYGVCLYTLGYLAGHSKGYGKAAIECWKATIR